MASNKTIPIWAWIGPRQC